MKTKKLLAAVCAAAMLTASFSAFAGCGGSGECEHKVLNWETTKAVSCVKNGERFGDCSLCGEVITETIACDPSDLSQHSYGNWIKTEPTLTEAGSAVKTCAESCTENHTYTVTLPALSEEDKYQVVTDKEATVAEEGHKTFTYTDANFPEEKIVIEYVVPKLPIATVEGAVESAYAHRNDIRQMSGGILDRLDYAQYKDAVESLGEDAVTGREVGCYYGDDYVHVTDAIEEVDDWYSRYTEDGMQKIFAGRVLEWDEEGKPSKTQNISGASESNFSGFAFRLYYSGISGYGAPQLLTNLYKAGKEKLAAQQVPAQSGGYYTFSFETLTEQALVDVAVTFSLDYEGILSYLKVEERAYDKYQRGMVPVIDRNSEDGFLHDEETGEIVYAEGYLTDENDNYIPLENPKANGVEPVGVGFIKCNNAAKSADDTVEENKLDYTSRRITEFYLKYGNEVVDENGLVKGQPIKAEAYRQVAEGGAYSLTPVVVKPSGGSFSNDAPRMYLRTDKGDVELPDYYTDAVNALGNYLSLENEILLNFKMKGIVTVAVKTAGGAERLVKFDVQPKVFNKNLTVVRHYEYNDNSGQETYSWVTRDSVSGVYAGQPLTFCLDANPESEDALEVQPYTDYGFVLSVSADGAFLVERGVFKDGAEGVLSFTDTTAGGASGVQLRFNQPGDYTVIFLCKREVEAGVKTPADKRITVQVQEAPTAQQLLAVGSVYTGKFASNTSVEVTVTSATEIAVAVDGATVILGYTINPDGSVTSQRTGGASKEIVRGGVTIEVYNFVLSLNPDTFRLNLTHPSGIYDDENEVILTEACVLTAKPVVQP